MTCRQAINQSTRLINSNKKPSLTEKAYELAQAYADRSGKPCYVFRRAGARENMLELRHEHPGPGEYVEFREFWPIAT